MREIETHKVNPANDKLTITVTDEKGAGGANHAYVVGGFDCRNNPSVHSTYVIDGDETDTIAIIFQNGPIAEVGVNGVTNEALLAVIADRLECFQRGPYANGYNAEALAHIHAAIGALHQRTIERMSRGVEGTHEK